MSPFSFTVVNTCVEQKLLLYYDIYIICATETEGNKGKDKDKDGNNHTVNSIKFVNLTAYYKYKHTCHAPYHVYSNMHKLGVWKVVVSQLVFQLG